MNNFYKNKSVLVTGGAGFIGSHLAEKLVNLGAKVNLLDNFSSGSEANIKPFVSKIKLFKDDIRNESACDKSSRQVDIIFHLAAMVSVPKSIQNQSECWDINVMGTFNILSWAVKHNVKKFILSSSSAVYGDQELPCDESDTPNPKSPYADSKLQAEKFCADFAQKYKLNTAALRYFNVYGPRQNPNGDYAAVVAKFTELLKNDKHLVIFGDGKQTRDFVEVQEVVNANLAMGMEESFFGEIVNVGCGYSINIFELIEMLENKLNKKHTGIIFKPARNGDILNSSAICEKYENIKQKYPQLQI